MRVVRCYSDKLTSDFILLLRAYRTIRKRLSAKRQTAQSVATAFCNKLCQQRNVATKLRCLGLCKVEMSLDRLAGSVSRRRGGHHIGAAPAHAGRFRLRFG
jgi:proline dehydrogenase